MTGSILDKVAGVGESTLDRVETFGRFTRFCISTLGWSIRGTRGFGRFRLLLPQLYFIGTRSIPVVMLVGAFVGAVLGVETFDQFKAIGQEARLAASSISPWSSRSARCLLR